LLSEVQKDLRDEIESSKKSSEPDRDRLLEVEEELAGDEELEGGPADDAEDVIEQLAEEAMEQDEAARKLEEARSRKESETTVKRLEQELEEKQTSF